MSRRWSTYPAEIADARRSFRHDEGFGVALRLLKGRQRLSFGWLIAARIAVGICDLSLAGAMYLLFLLLQGGSPSRHLWWTPKTTLSAALIASSLVVLRAAMDLLSTRSVVGQIQDLYRDFLLRLTHGYGEMSWTRFVECNRSELLNHTIYTACEAADFYHYCVEMAAAVTVVAIMAATLVHESPVAACALGGTVILFYGVHRFFIRKRLQLAAAEREQSLRVLQRSLADMFLSWKEIRTYGNQAFFSDRIRKQSGRFAENNLRVVIFPQVARIVSDQGVVLLFLCIIVALQLRHGNIHQVLSLLVFYFVVSRRLLPLVSQISFMAGQMESSYENVRVLDSELAECLLHRTVASARRLPSAGFVLELEQVSFSFEADMPVLRGINLHVYRGETIVLRGASGIGKSSILNLIAGILQPVTGLVRVDRESVAYVPQDVVLLDDSIRNNLLFGLPEKSDAELLKVLAIANLEEFVVAQPLGLDTGVGDNGAFFSGGQRQRLGIARAVLRDANLLLLDEATSALDEENEAQVLENLGNSGMAVLLVTHRIHRQTLARRMFRLQEGRLIEETIGEMPISGEPVEPTGMTC
jgi:ABC-type multidrug transport system fused ATPase/permease subunit